MATSLWAGMGETPINLVIQKVTFSSNPPGVAYLYLDATKADGSAMLGLNSSNIHVTMDGQYPMTIDNIVPFAGTDRGLAYVLAVDANENLATSLTTVRQGAVNFIKAMGFRYWGSLVTYDEPPVILGGPTRDAERLVEVVSGLKPLARPPQLADGLLLAVDVLTKTVAEHQFENMRTAIILFTDGRDQGSRFSLEAAAAKVLESGAQLFLIGYGRSDAPNMAVLKALALKTGGRVYSLSEPDSIPGALTKVADILKYQYIISFSGERVADGGEHTIEVTVSGNGFKGKTALQFMSPKLTWIIVGWPIYVGGVFLLVLAWLWRRHRLTKGR